MRILSFWFVILSNYIKEILFSHIAVSIAICSLEYFVNLLLRHVFSSALDCIFQIIYTVFACIFMIKCGKNDICLCLSEFFIKFSSGQPDKFSKIDEAKFFLQIAQDVFSEHTMMMEAQIHECLFDISYFYFTISAMVK